jgi:hypothetical protein
MASSLALRVLLACRIQKATMKIKTRADKTPLAIPAIVLAAMGFLGQNDFNNRRIYRRQIQTLLCELLLALIGIGSSR